jgi:hypothetical protein
VKGGQQSALFSFNQNVMSKETVESILQDFYRHAHDHGANAKGLMCELTRTDQPKRLQQGKIKVYKEALAEFSDEDGYIAMIIEKVKKIAIEEANIVGISSI